jgi:hypothetical protein
MEGPLVLAWSQPPSLLLFRLLLASLVLLGVGDAVPAWLGVSPPSADANQRVPAKC